MSIEEFNRLSEEDKKIAIFEAEKVSERQDGGLKFEVFRIDNFYVEVKTSLVYAFKRLIKAVDGEKFRSHPFHSF